MSGSTSTLDFLSELGIADVTDVKADRCDPLERVCTLEPPRTSWVLSGSREKKFVSNI
jgi:hypothetical protein